MPAEAGAVETHDRVDGSGTSAFGDFSFDLPSGTYRVHGPFGAWEATEKCLRVAGDRATLGLSIDSDRSALLWIHEVAGPGTVYARIVPASQPIVCADPLAGPDPSLAALDVVGYIHVEDVGPSSPPGSDSVTGEVEQCFARDFDGQCSSLVSFSPAAVSGRLGAHPGGTLSLDVSGTTPGSITRSDAAVTCLWVKGHTAIVGFTGSRHRAGASEAIYPYAGLARVSDGAADSLQLAVENGIRNGPSLPGPTDCSAFPGRFPDSGGTFTFDDASGDVVVHDALSRSQARDACRFERVANGVAAFRAKYGRMRNCVLLYLL